MHRPLETPVTVVPLTVQVPAVIVENVTGRLEVAVADSVPATPTVIIGADPKEMV
mgnify:CR=1 FL=1